MSTPRDGDEAVPEIGFDPEAVLGRDSRVLLDPAFLAALHRELEGELPREQAALTLLQMGFLHGLQDATRVLTAPSEAGGSDSHVFAPPLRMLWRASGAGDGSAGLRIEGEWPECHEAEAHLSSLGSSDAVACHLSAGYTSGWLSGTFGADLLAVETGCSVAGARQCRFLVCEDTEWRARGDSDVLRSLAALPFDAFRALVRERVARTSHAARESATETASVDRQAAAVHIWGPVMVIPWAGADATLHTLEVLARDAGASEVSVIVLDLQGAIIDEVDGALALEQLIQISDSWGTEVLFVDPSSLSESVLADLEPRPLLTLKDLEPAVALAFQIARSQRRTL
jgi:hypothetical protein